MTNSRNSFRSTLLVGCYRFWHGRLHLKGAGVLLRFFARFFPELRRYTLKIPRLGELTVDLKDPSGMAWLNRSLGEAGEEEGLVIAIKRLSPKNPVVWDVGANGGVFAATLAEHLKDFAEIRLFEPNPALIPSLRQLAQSIPRMHVHHLAFSDSARILTLHIPLDCSTTASIRELENSRPVEVECTTGDLFLADKSVTPPDVVVIDTEGNDCNVIRGLRELIELRRPVIFFEHIFVTEESIVSIVPESYTQYTVDDGSGELIEGFHPIRGHNSVLVPIGASKETTFSRE